MRQLTLFNAYTLQREVDNADMQRAIHDVRHRKTVANIARDMGWLTHHKTWPRGDTSRVKRAFGLLPTDGKLRKSCNIEHAELLIRACDLDPYWYGI